jgi:hypothetical protein
MHNNKVYVYNPIILTSSRPSPHPTYAFAAAFLILKLGPRAFKQSRNKYFTLLDAFMRSHNLHDFLVPMSVIWVLPDVDGGTRLFLQGIQVLAVLADEGADLIWGLLI